MRDESRVPTESQTGLQVARTRVNDGETGPTVPGGQPEVHQVVQVEVVEDTPVITIPESYLEKTRRYFASLAPMPVCPLLVTTELYRELSRLRFFLRRNGRIVYRKPHDRTSGWCARFRLPRQNTDVFYDLPVVDAEQARVAEMIVRNWRPRRRRRPGPHTSIHIRMNDQLFARRHRDCTDGTGG